MSLAITLPEEAMLHSFSIGHHLDRSSNTLKRTSFSLLPLSGAPGGTTLMMTAKDLITFACAHIGDGQGPNGERILSKKSAGVMRIKTAAFESIGPIRGVGLGWMLFDNGMIGHGGGARGVASWFYLHPDKSFAMAVLTNSEHGSLVIRDLVRSRLWEYTQALLTTELPIKIQGAVDQQKFVGIYEDVWDRYIITATDSSIGVSTQNKFVSYDSMSAALTPVVPLR